MIQGRALATALSKTPSQSLTRHFYRAADYEALHGFHRSPPYPAVRPLWGLGAPKSGARFTQLGGPSSLYIAENPVTALAEVTRVRAYILASGPSEIGPISPIVIFSVKVHLETVLDLTLPHVQVALGTSEAELKVAWRLVQSDGRIAPTQLLGQAIFDSGRYQAIRYSSDLSPGSACLVIYEDRVRHPAYVELYDPNGNLKGRLPS